jgi:hypothetical protein
MAYSLVHSVNDPVSDRIIGENVYIENMPHDSDIFVFYYPSTSAPYTDLEDKLRAYGEKSEKAVFVNMSKVGGDKYSKIIKRFEIEGLPVIVITGRDTIAGLQTEDNKDKTVFVRLDKKNLLKDGGRTMEVVEEIVNLFMEGKISEAFRQAKASQHVAVLVRVKEIVSRLLTSIDEITIGLIDGSFKVKFKGGSF